MYGDDRSSVDQEYLGRYTVEIIQAISDHPEWSDSDVAAHVNDLRGANVGVEEVRAEREGLAG